MIEMQETPFVWLSWWQEADWIVRSVFILLIALSALSWTVIFTKLQQFVSLHRQEKNLSRSLLDRTTSHRAMEQLPGWVPSSHVIAELERGKDLPERELTEAHVTHILRERRIEMENGLTLLATIGNAAPFIGLFGTVWGIMHALQGLGGGAAPSMDMVAGPVAEALVATAAGLFTAIPAVVGYNLLLRLLRRIAAVMEGNAARLIGESVSDAGRDS